MNNSMTTLEVKGNTLIVDSDWAAEVLKKLLLVDGITLDGKTFVGRFGQVCYKDIWFWLRICGDGRTVEFDYIYEASPPLNPSIKNKVAAKRFVQEINQRSPLKWTVSKNAFTHELRFSLHHEFSDKNVHDMITKLIDFLDYVQSQKPLLDKFSTKRNNKHA